MGGKVDLLQEGTLFMLLLLAGCGTIRPIDGPAVAADATAIEAQSAFAQGNTAQAIDLLKMSLNHNRGTDRLPAVAQNLNDLGVMRMSARDRVGAQQCLDEALSLFQRLGDERGALSARLNLVGLQCDAANPAVVKELEAITQDAQKLGLPGIAGSAQNQLGQGAAREKKYAQALEFFGKALDLHRSLKSSLGETSCLHNIADVEISLGRYAQAKGHLEKAIAIDKANGFWTFLGDDLFLMGRFLAALKDAPGARQHYERAFDVYRFAGNAAKMDAARAAMQAP